MSRAQALHLDLLPEPLALVQLRATAAIPGWVAAAREFCSVTRTPQELSIVVDASSVPEGVEAERSYRAFRVQGPLPLHLVGILASLTAPLAAAAVPIFTIATYDTDYILVKTADLARAEQALLDAGHRIVRREPRIDW